VAKPLAVVNRFPQYELAIRRLCALDPGFLGACEDYAEAAIALRHWEQAGAGQAARAEEYRRILGDIEADILADVSIHLLRVSRHDD
jgi:hypothetical protein